MGSIGSNNSIIERNTDGEILFKFSGTDRFTGSRVVGMEISAIDLQSARNDIRNNGYTIATNTLLPRKLFDRVMNETNVNSWDWQDAQEEFKNALKRKR